MRCVCRTSIRMSQTRLDCPVKRPQLAAGRCRKLSARKRKLVSRSSVDRPRGAEPPITAVQSRSCHTPLARAKGAAPPTQPCPAPPPRRPSSKGRRSRRQADKPWLGDVAAARLRVENGAVGAAREHAARCRLDLLAVLVGQPVEGNVAVGAVALERHEADRPAKVLDVEAREGQREAVGGLPPSRVKGAVRPHVGQRRAADAARLVDQLALHQRVTQNDDEAHGRHRRARAKGARALLAVVVAQRRDARVAQQRADDEAQVARHERECLRSPAHHLDRRRRAIFGLQRHARL
mmetsp:Transcript_23953/g.64232  ORF Transcript_23953/g.64232 Transcript_23953/m.64232 type:complete len:293 (-) Transcript_23953:266-1144(-)